MPRTPNTRSERNGSFPCSSRVGRNRSGRRRALARAVRPRSPLARRAVEGLDRGQLTARPAPDANSIAWLVWHLTRVQDHHVAELLDTDQLWAAGGYAQGFG